MGYRTPKLVKECINKLDDTHRTYIEGMKIKEPKSGWRYSRISTGLKWNGSELVISGLAQKELRAYSNLLSEFPKEYKFKLY